MGQVLDLDDELTFGKYEGYTVREAIAKDPSYMRWLVYSATTVSFTEEVEAEI